MVIESPFSINLKDIFVVYTKFGKDDDHPFMIDYCENCPETVFVKK